MGMYDSIWIDGVEWQTKALGKHLRDYAVGDAAMVERIPTTDEQYAEARTHHYDVVPERYTVEVMAHAHLLIENGRIVGVRMESDGIALPVDRFDYHGRDTFDELAHIFGQSRPPRTFHPGQPPLSSMPQRPRRHDIAENREGD
mgnify:CR=1 FL=1